MKRFDRNPFRIEAWDRRRAAVHEAGHEIMARHVGLLDPWSEIYRIDVPNISREKTWRGRTSWKSTHVSDWAVAMVAVAGAVAEYTWEPTDLWEDWIECAFEDENAKSATDWAMAKCEPGEPNKRLFRVLTAVHKLFCHRTGKLWPSVTSRARALIVESRPVPAWEIRARAIAASPENSDLAVAA